MIVFQVSGFSLQVSAPNGRHMGCADRVEQIVSVVDLIEFDEGRID